VRAIVAAILLAVASLCSACDDGGPAPPAGQVAAGPAVFQADQALKHIGQLSVAIGPRVAGSTGERAAAEYIAAQLRASGYTVTIQEFEFTEDPFRPAVLRIDGEEVEVFTMAGTSGGTVSAPGVYVGLAGPDDVQGLDIAGKIAVADRGVTRFAEKFAVVRRAGAAALIVVNNEPGELLGTLYDPVDAPAVGVSQEGGARILAAVQAGRTLTLDMPEPGITRSVNVLARAKADGACDLLVGGHHDTVPGSPGAHDNASGSALVIELARAMAADGLDAGLCFATFGGEESGLHGSRAMVREMEAAGALPRTMVNLDTIGVGNGLELVGSPLLTSRAEAITARLNIPAAVATLGFGFGSDHQNFEQAGVEVIFFASNDLGKFHTPGDTIETIDRVMIEWAGAVVLELLKELVRPGGPA
jgi:Zn-dependent M28 family amino/carboxypeptidase